MKVSELAALVGGLSEPSKMPGFAYGIPAQACKLGAILAKKKGSVCNSCYALKGMYVFPVVKNAQAKRLKILLSDMFAWKRAMVSLLEKKYRRKTGDERVFRWHDSGDLQSVSHLQAIVEIANLLPDIRFWRITISQSCIDPCFEPITFFTGFGVRSKLKNCPGSFIAKSCFRKISFLAGDL